MAIVLAWIFAGHINLLRSGFNRLISWQSGRPITVRGALHLHILTRSPRIEAERVTIGNPPWTKPGITAEVAKITVEFAPVLSHQSGLSLVRIENAQLQLIRDSDGHANWQRVDPDRSAGGPLPMIRALELTHTHVTLVDERLHLVFEGDVSVDGRDSSQRLEMAGSGTLNQRAVVFSLTGDALPSASPDKPYRFEFDEHSSGTHLTAHGSLPKPFDLGMIDAQFEASGPDLRDLHYLVGIDLPNTGTFHLRGRMAHRDRETLFDDLNVTSGQSDVQGRVSIVTQEGGRPRLRADLSSMQLRLSDVGLRAAGRDPHLGTPPTLFSDVQLITPASRRVDAAGIYRVGRLLMSRVEVTELSVPFKIERGMIKAKEVTGHFLGGSVVLQLASDVNQTPARTRIEMTLTDLQLGHIPHTGEPPAYEGLLRVQIHVQGGGDSLHAFAADANGSFSARALHGRIRASLAELAGVDLRGLGLILTGSKSDAAVDCAAADFSINSGIMQSTRLFIDSEPVFISGEGRVFLDSETLEIKLRGEPKRLRILRIKAPLLVQGTLLKPQFTVGVADSTLLLVDRGTPHSADCAAPPIR